MAQSSDQTARLNLPKIMSSQAQKHVTHNEALQILDSLVQLSLIQTEAIDPPATPTVGDAYGLGDTPQGAWSEKSNELAVWDGFAWHFATPHEGMIAWNQASTSVDIFRQGAWTAQTVLPDTVTGLGVNSSWDSTNRLTISAAATLLSHEGDDHRLKVNKADYGNTASLLFQSGFVGHAEMGLTGSTDFSLKVSADGSNWRDAIRVNSSTGTLEGDAVQQSATDTTPGRIMRAEWGYGPGNLIGVVAQTSGTPTGAVLETGENSNGNYIRWADGTQMCMRKVLIDAINCSISSGSLYHTGLLGDFDFPAPFSQVTFASATLNGSDAATIRDSSLQARFGYNQTANANDWNGLVLFATQSVTASAGEMTEFSFFAVGRWF